MKLWLIVVLLLGVVNLGLSYPVDVTVKAHLTLREPHERIKRFLGFYGFHDREAATERKRTRKDNRNRKERSLNKHDTFDFNYY
ncbi:unnamed protein product [Bursaphelenchus okinawaensis]|uniref:Uncharacterized protein n=1 Tax=Bursaphelenchus okinawaensis TaxID=465554 RepID=A0A811L1K6_9BILA|nr:unnamed protein product [Bursaphelenchus okinawaensis]CAG9117043.1 unnamed protein product [Bursaphelenchus okinawaensis]